jgi:hypothetical protein
VASLCLVLAGCGSWFEEPQGRPDCPQVGILPEGATLTRFRPGGGTDLTDVTAEARVVGLAGRCERARDRVRVAVDVQLEAAAGPAAGPERAVDLPWFVAVLGPDQQIVDRRAFSTRFAYPAGRVTPARATESVDIVLPAGQPPGAFGVLVSWQLTEAEMAYNRRARR